VGLFKKLPAWLRLLPQFAKPTFEELAYFSLFGLMPVWLGSVFKYASDKSLSIYFNNYLYSGEALLICATVIGPMMFMIQKTYGSNSENFGKSFPYKSLFLLLIFFVCTVSAAITGLKQGSSGENSVSRDAVWYISIIVTLTTIFVWLGVTALKTIVDKLAPQIMRTDTEDFASRYANNDPD
jgi:hypothetical protein